MAKIDTTFKRNLLIDFVYSQNLDDEQHPELKAVQVDAMANAIHQISRWSDAEVALNFGALRRQGRI